MSIFTIGVFLTGAADTPFSDIFKKPGDIIPINIRVSHLVSSMFVHLVKQISKTSSLCIQSA